MVLTFPAETSEDARPASHFDDFSAKPEKKNKKNEDDLLEPVFRKTDESPFYKNKSKNGFKQKNRELQCGFLALKI